MDQSSVCAGLATSIPQASTTKLLTAASPGCGGYHTACAHRFMCNPKGLTNITGTAGDERIASNMAKGLAFVLVGAGCWAVLPSIGKSSIGHAIGLLGANDTFFVRSGLVRLRFLARSDDYALSIVENGGVLKLMDLLQQTTEKELLHIVLEVLEKLAQFDSSRLALKKAGLEARIHTGVEERWLESNHLTHTILLEMERKIGRPTQQ